MVMAISVKAMKSIKAMKSRVLVYFLCFHALKVRIAKENGLKSEVRSECLVFIDNFL